MPYPDAFQAHAAGSPYAPQPSDLTAAYEGLAQTAEAMADRLYAATGSLLDRSEDRDADWTMLADAKAKLGQIADLIAALESAI